MHVDDGVFEVFVEDAGLDFEGGLGGFELALEIEDGLVGLGGDVERIHQAEDGAEDGDDGGDPDEVPDAEAGGAHGDDFGVGGEAAEAEQYADQNGHGDGDEESVGQGENEGLQYSCKAGAVADDHLEDVLEIAHEEDEGEKRAANQRVGRDFTENVSSENAHGSRPSLSLRHECGRVGFKSFALAREGRASRGGGGCWRGR